SRLHVDAVGDVAVGFRSVADKRQFVAFTSDKGRQRIAKLVVGLVAPDWIVLWVFLRHLLSLGVAIKHRTEHRSGTGTDGAVVEINLIFWDKELVADLRPISVLFVGILSGMGQPGRNMGQLREKRMPRRECKSQTTYRLREKMAAIQDESLRSEKSE